MNSQCQYGLVTYCHEIVNSFINLITCLESYFTPKDGNPIGTAIAEAIALILGNNFESRKKIKNRIKQFYGKRSGISHGGGKVILDSEHDELIMYAHRSTMWLINNKTKFNSTNELLSWIEEKKLG